MIAKKSSFLLAILAIGSVFLFATSWGRAEKTERVFAGVSCVSPPPGMVSWWPGDGNAVDIHGANNGTLINGTSFASGKVGQAFSFDGSDDGLLVPDVPALNFGEGADFSLDAWIRLTPNAPTPSTNHFTILSKRFAPTDTAKPTGFELFLFEGKLGFQLADDSEANGFYQNFIATTPDLRDGNFHHVAATLDRGVVDGGRLFVDGQIVLTFDTDIETGDLSTTEPLRIGIHATDGFDAFFSGLIDEVDIFNRTLSPTEVLAIYSAGDAGKCKDFSIFLPMIIKPCQGHYLDNFNDSDSGWPSSDSSTSQIGYLADEYRILVKTANSWSGARPGVQATDFRVSVDVRNAIGAGGTYGIIFGLAEDWSQFYTFEIGLDGFYRIWQYGSGSWTLLELDSSSQINSGTASNRLRVERNGSQIKAYANGQLLITLTNSSFIGERHVGLITSTYDQANLDARFDNFDVCSFSGSLNVTHQPLLMQTGQSLAIIWSSSTDDVSSRSR